MHVKNIHEAEEKLAEYGRRMVEAGAGEGKVDLKSAGEVIDMIKDLAEAEYYARMAKCLEKEEKEAEEDEKEERRMFYRGQPRRRNGEFMSRRGYREPDYHMMPEFMYPITGVPAGDKMYFTGQVGGNMGNRTASNYRATQVPAGGGMAYYSDGRASGGDGMNASRHGYSHDAYMEQMKMHDADSPEGKKKRHELFRERALEIADMLAEEADGMTKEEKQMWRNQLNKMIND